jgi:thiol-disulfide isomerase/thioredoxin
MANQSFETGNIELGIGYEYELSNHAHRGHEVTANPKEEITEFSTVSLRAAYSLAPKFRLHALLPFRSILAPKTDVPSGDRYLREFSGVGDVLLSGTWLPFVSDNSDRTIIGITFGLRLPTGSSDPDHDWGYGNSRDPVLQPGYGTVDPLFGLSWTRAFGRFGTSASAVTRLSGGTNVHGYRYAEEYQGTLGASYSFSDWIDGGVSGAVITSAHDFDNGAMVQNTGGLWGYLVPQLTLRSTGVRFEPSVQIPVYSFVNGGQLVSDAIYSVGMSFDIGQTASRMAEPERGVGQFGTVRPSNVRFATACNTCGLTNLIESERMTLVEVMSEQCGACRDFEPELLRFASDHPQVEFRQVDYFSLTPPQVAELGVEQTPTLILYGQDGKLLHKVTGTDLREISRFLK